MNITSPYRFLRHRNEPAATPSPSSPSNTPAGHRPRRRRHAAAAPTPEYTSLGRTWPQPPPAGYLGQLDRSHQARLAELHTGDTVEECDFYHTSVLSDGTIMHGPWDLRGTEDTYLGGIHFRGRRTLELGPASGHLTYYMESRKADVVSLDVGYDIPVDVIPCPDTQNEELTADVMRMIGKVQNAWWYLHRDRKSSAKAVYGNIYDMPKDLGRFDISVFGAILLHLRDPFGALRQAAARTTDTIVVTDAVQDPTLDPADNVMRFASAGPSNLTVWWTITPGAIERMLRHLGFGITTTTFHTQKHNVAHDMSQDAVDMQMFTVVGRRG